MSDLRRRRDARDIWISRGHLGAGLMLMVVSSGTSFVLGFLVGRDEAASSPVTVAPIGIPGDELVDLLARVEASALSDGGLEALTFPDALRGDPGGGPEVPSPTAGRPAPDGQRVQQLQAVSAPQGVPSSVGKPPAGEFTVVVGSARALGEMRELQKRLSKLGLESWVGAELVEGGTVYKVAVGAFATTEEAEAALPIVRATGLGATVSPLGVLKRQ
jgi:hypothetical protein